MSSVWREVNAELRRSRAQMQLAGAAYGVRDWLSDLDPGRPLLAAIDAMPDVLDVRALLDPLQDSALTRLTEASRATGAAEELVAESQNARAEQTSHPVRRVSAAIRFADDSHAVRSSSTPPGAHALATAANMPARVAALLARYEHVRWLVAEDAVQRAPWSDVQRNERKVVPFAGHRAIASESMLRSQAAGSPAPLRALLARWSEIAAAEPAQRLKAATGRARAGIERTQLEAPLAPLDPASLPMRGAPAALERSAMVAAPALPPAVVRLGDLAAPALPQDTQRAHASPTPVQAAGDAASAPVPPAATSESVLGRMAGALARIEERLLESKPSAEPRTQWLTEDDNLAERIHDILRRQALRHGINAP